METLIKSEYEWYKLKQAAPAWVYRLMYPADKVVLESLSLDALFEWMSNLTAGNPKDVWEMYFLAEEIKPEYEKWIYSMYNEKHVGSIFKRIKSIPTRYKRGIPLWD